MHWVVVAASSQEAELYPDAKPKVNVKGIVERVADKGNTEQDLLAWYCIRPFAIRPAGSSLQTAAVPKRTVETALSATSLYVPSHRDHRPGSRHQEACFRADLPADTSLLRANGEDVMAVQETLRHGSR